MPIFSFVGYNKKKYQGDITRLRIKQLLEVFYEKAILLKTSQYSQDEQENTCVRVSF